MDEHAINAHRDTHAPRSDRAGFDLNLAPVGQGVGQPVVAQVGSRPHLRQVVRHGLPRKPQFALHACGAGCQGHVEVMIIKRKSVAIRPKIHHRKLERHQGLAHGIGESPDPDIPPGNSIRRGRDMAGDVGGEA
ncbi:MAG: hypothetical protein ACK5QX_00340 [bacterium]